MHPELEELRRLEEEAALLEAQVLAKKQLRQRAEEERKKKQRAELLSKLQATRERTELLKRQLSRSDSNEQQEQTPALKRAGALDSAAPSSPEGCVSPASAAAATPAKPGATASPTPTIRAPQLRVPQKVPRQLRRLPQRQPLQFRQLRVPQQEVPVP